MPRQAEVAHVGVLAVLGRRDEDVARLHVAVDEPGGVRRVQCTCHLLDESDRSFRFEASGLAQELTQVGALDELHRQVEAAAILAGGDRPHDVRILEAGSELGLAQKTLPEPLVARERVVEELQRDDLPALVASPVHLGHRAVAQRRFDTEPRDDRSR